MTCTQLLKNLTVLLVEDEPHLAHLLRNAIGSHFARFELAHDGKEGLSKVQDIHPDIVITDITMPHMSGLEMSGILHEEDPDLPIVILSAYSEKEYLLDAIDIGITKYLIKPFDPDELLDVLCALAQKMEKARRTALMAPYQFDTGEKKLFHDKTMVRLTQRETRFLDALLAHPNHFLPTEDINTTLWNDENVTDERLRVFINRLRQKTDPALIENVVGQGYVLRMSRPGKQG